MTYYLSRLVDDTLSREDGIKYSNVGYATPYKFLNDMLNFSNIAKDEESMEAYSILKGYLENSETGEDFIDSLRKNRIDYILYNSSEFVRLNRIYNRLNSSDCNKFSEFIKLLDPVFHKDYSYVYKIPYEFKRSKAE